ncbi:MAG: hypothetical protein Fur0035_13150 [Anaerolineales bacterium]
MSENAKTARRARLLEAASQVGKQVTSILKLEELLPKTVDIICEAYGFYYAGVFLIDEAEQRAVLRAGHGEAGKAMLAAAYQLKLGSHSMIGWAIEHRKARIALDVDADAEHFKNPYLPKTRSEMALPLIVGEKVLGAVTVQSEEERAFSDEDILTLQTMADQLAVAINNAYLLRELEQSNAELLRAKTYEALTAATTQAIHWIGNKALPMSTAIERIRQDAPSGKIDPEDLSLLAESVRLILDVKENLLGPIREPKMRPAMADDLLRAAASQVHFPASALHIESAPGAGLLLGDTTQLIRAFGNLFKNAMEARASQVQVKISPAEKSMVSITIEDDGDGIANDLKDKIWAVFFTTRPGHSGLGLPAAMLVINQHQGSIALASIPRQGTSVTIFLPAATHPESGLISSGKKTILLLDDADPWADFAAQTLSAAGHSVLREIGKTPDLVLVDEFQQTPLEDVLASLAAAGLTEKTILLSAAPSAERMNHLAQKGFRRVALKPYTQAEFHTLE